MADRTTPSVLRRMAEAGRAPTGGGALTPVRALGQSFAKAADEVLRLNVEVLDCRETRISLAEIPERIDDNSLLVVLEGPEEALGVVALSPTLLATLIEMQTTGRISGADPPHRRPTRTDAALSVRFVNAVLSLFETLLSADPAVVWAGRFRYGSVVDDPRPLGLMLEDCVYRALQVSLDCGSDPVRRCGALLILPAEGRGPAPLREASSGTGAEAGEAKADFETDWHDRMDYAVMGARAPVVAVLDRIKLPFATLLALKPGETIPLSKNALTTLRVEGQGRRFLTYGKLGQVQGSLAVRMHMAGLVDDVSDGELADALSSGAKTGAAKSPASVSPADPAARAKDVTPGKGERT